MNKKVLAALIGASLAVAQLPVHANSTLYWWHHNDGTPVYVEPDFYYPALSVVPKESGWREDAVSSGWYIDHKGLWKEYYHCGWFQIEMHIHYQRFVAHDWSWNDCKDPGKNSEIAHEIWSEQGWRPWPNTARGYY